MKKVALAAFAAILLAGCQTTTPEGRMAENRAKCAGYGFAAGTDAYAACMMQMDRDADEVGRQRQRAVGQAFQNMGNSMQQNRPVTCNTSYTPSGIVGRAPVGSTTTCR